MAYWKRTLNAWTTLPATRSRAGAHRPRRRPRRAATRPSITLLAVTKVFPAAVDPGRLRLGLREFGENYVQEFEGKAPRRRRPCRRPLST